LDFYVVDILPDDGIVLLDLCGDVMTLIFIYEMYDIPL